MPLTESNDRPSEPQEHQAEGSSHADDPNLADSFESSEESSEENIECEENYKSFHLMPLLFYQVLGSFNWPNQTFYKPGAENIKQNWNAFPNYCGDSFRKKKP